MKLQPEVAPLCRTSMPVVLTMSYQKSVRLFTA